MAKLERVMQRDFHQLLAVIEQGIINGSASASLEEASDFHDGDARFARRKST